MLSRERPSLELLEINARMRENSKEKVKISKASIKEIIRKNGDGVSPKTRKPREILSTSHVLTNEKPLKTPDCNRTNRGALYLHKSTEFFKNRVLKNRENKVRSLKKKDLKFESCDALQGIQDKLKSQSTKNIHISSFEVFDAKVSCKLGKSASYFKGVNEKRKIKIKPTKKVRTEISLVYLRKKGSMSSPFRRRKKQFLRIDAKRKKKRVNQQSYDSSPVRLVKGVKKPCRKGSNNSCKDLSKMIENIYNENKCSFESKFFKEKEEKMSKNLKRMINNCNYSRENLSYSINMTRSLKIAKQGFFGKDKRKFSPNGDKGSKGDLNLLRKSKKKFEQKEKEKNLRIKKKGRRDKKKITRKHRLSKIPDNLIQSQNINSSIGKVTNKSRGCTELRGSHFATHVSQGRRASNMKKNYKELIKMMKRTTKRRKDNQSSSRKTTIRSTFFSPTIQMLTRTRNLSSKAKEQIKQILKEKKDPRNKKTELLDIIRKYTSKKKSNTNTSKLGVSEVALSKSVKRKVTVDEYDLGSTELNSQHETAIMNSEIFKSYNDKKNMKVLSDNGSQKENQSVGMGEKFSLFKSKKGKRRNTFLCDETSKGKDIEAKMFEDAINGC